MITNKLTIGRDFDYYSLMQVAQPVDCVPVKGEDPLYILYTSGTTGYKPYSNIIDFMLFFNTIINKIR